jgi:hypothetical protein
MHRGRRRDDYAVSIRRQGVIILCISEQGTYNFRATVTMNVNMCYCCRCYYYTHTRTHTLTHIHSCTHIHTHLYLHTSPHTLEVHVCRASSPPFAPSLWMEPEHTTGNRRSGARQSIYKYAAWRGFNCRWHPTPRRDNQSPGPCRFFCASFSSRRGGWWTGVVGWPVAAASPCIAGHHVSPS